MIERQLQKKIESRMFAGKAIIVIGARQVGKSTLFRMILDKQDCKTLHLNCDEPEVRDMLTNINTSELRLLIADNKIVVIDEAQRVENIGMTLKLITDNFPTVQLLSLIHISLYRWCCPGKRAWWRHQGVSDTAQSG